ncbi:MAG: ABC transporter substrate-binding protein [Selenomonadaceae bacterium]|nr:ABC transporter substrate-binding protein [Selenomonadaceae bacterium]
MLRSIGKILPLLLSMLLLLTTGCGSDQNASKTQQITIAVQPLPNDDSIARSWYVEELGKAFNAKVVILNYDSSLLANNAMATGNIDIAVFGSATAAIGISNGLPYEIFWIHNVEGENESIVVKNEAEINSIADLKGKRVGVTFGATVHYALLQAMQRAGLSINDVKLFDMQPPEMLNAWREEQLDAAFIWQPTLDELLRDGHVLVNSRQLDEQGITTADVGVVNREFAQKHPDIVKKYVELQVKAQKLYRDDPNAAAAITADSLNLTVEEALKQMNELVWLDANEQISDRYLGTSERKGHFVQTLLETAQFLEKSNVVDRAASFDKISEAINPSFAQAVAK